MVIKFIIAFVQVYYWQTIAVTVLILICAWYSHNRKVNILRMSGIHDIDKMDGVEFENRVKLLYEDMGYNVKKTPASGDYGADLIAKRPGEKIVIQCKRYSHPVGVKAVQEAVAAVMHYKANRAMVITNNKFTKQAQALAKTNKVELWNRAKLIEALYSVSKKEEADPLDSLLEEFK